MTVIDIAREEVVTLGPDATVSEAVQRMYGASVGSIVVTEDDRPLGLVTDRDVAIEVLGRELDPGDVSLGELIDGDPVTIDADAGVYDLVERMSEASVRRVPVVEDGALVGIVSLSDVVVLLGMELQHLATAIRSTSPAYESSTMGLYD